MTYQGSVALITGFAHSAPVAVVFFVVGDFAAVGFVAILTILTISPSIQLHSDFPIVTATIAVWRGSTPYTFIGVGRSIERTAQGTIIFLRIPKHSRGTTAWLMRDRGKARLATFPAVGDIAVRGS